MATTYESTGQGLVFRRTGGRVVGLDLADCAARMTAMTADTIIRARGDYEAEIASLRKAVSAEWNLLLDVGRARGASKGRV